MKANKRLVVRTILVVSALLVFTEISTWHRADTGSCSGQTITLPFTDDGALIDTWTGATNARQPVFDGTNIWVPNAASNTISVVRASGSFAGAVLATLSGKGLNSPTTCAFDGERILVTDFDGDRVSLWKASDFSPIDNIATPSGSNPWGACSDGVNFWISLLATGKLARF